MAVQQVETNTSRVISAFANNQINGDAMAALSAQRETIEEQARMAGIVPFSVWNFNPVDILIWQLGKKISVPAYNSTLGNKQTVKFRDGERVASSLVVRDFKGYSSPTSADFVGDPNVPRVTRTWRLAHPIELVRPFEHHYNSQPGSMGGVLVFQGDGHDIAGNTDKVISIPGIKRAKNGTLLYHPIQLSLAEKLDEIFGKQKAFTLAKCREARDWSEDLDPAMRKSVQDGPQGHIAWGQFAIDMGWQDQGRLGWMTPDNADQGCIKCGKMRTSGTAFFCQCGHPYDPYEAFMAGMKVDHDVLATLPEKQLKAIKAEMKRRANLFKDFPNRGEESQS